MIAALLSSAGALQKGTRMLIGDLIRVLILQLCTTGESNRLAGGFSFFK